MIVKASKKSKVSCRCPDKFPKGDCVYFLSIKDDELAAGGQLVKVGTTNDLVRRMKEHLRYYDKDIDVLWVSPQYSKYTTLRVEDRTKEALKQLGYIYINNDRFVLPKEVTEVEIKVRKTYRVSLR